MKSILLKVEDEALFGNDKINKVCLNQINNKKAK